MRLGKTIANFTAQTTHGPIQFHNWQGESYVHNKKIFQNSLLP